ncbi:hypothetical protein AS850_08825 [Frondihabitans sp. 762G35]|uniref:zinc ribbon domain-containing protein n=1 Tax=Frondihabitans sp. 762G35 TaxID=1446794 RepID=UPI000D201F3B|nr:zinc ribbon domain-containing protein [Frondihabitans sp. 762G35]ARC57177.1 hypothetical protein AS850_08825 [Frondihabitans sp. 762G35]
MHCPTCSSPLPDGAMFCGQCGRSITGADWAAFRRRGSEADVAEGEAPESIPAWQLQEPPAAAVPAGTPWWVGDRDPDDAGVDEVAPLAAPEEPSPAEPSPSQLSPSAPSPAEPSPSQPMDLTHPQPEQPADVSSAPPSSQPTADDESGARTAARHEVTEPDAGAGAPAPTEPARPAPLRRPDGVDAPSGRPTSAPLWTASLTPVTDTEADAGADAESSAAHGESPLDTPRDAPAPIVDESDQPDRTEDVRPVEAPRPGDTNVIAPLVAPASELVDGRLHCTNCGAPLHEDDIFCGECGAVRASVAQSFTGPITPIITDPAPTSAASPRESPGRPAAPANAEPSTGAPANDAPRADEPAPAPESAPPAAPQAKKRRLFGRRGQDAAPQLWSTPAAGFPSPTAAPGPTASPSPSTPTGAEIPPIPGGPLPASAPDPEPGPPPLSVDEVPVAPRATPSVPVPAPLAATPVAAPSQTAEPVLAPVPKAPESPRSAAPWLVGSGEDDVEKTRIVRRQPLGEPFVLQFSTGESFTVQGSGLVGRAPTPQPGEAIDLLVRIVDPGKSVSKTHLEFGQEDGALWVSDRWSGNGSVVREPSSEARPCEPGKRVRVVRGSRVDIGEQFFIVH